jgi:undecaprenyl-diphosphatase
MDILKAIILGFIQGITEFFPVSSTGHLILLENFWGVKGSLAFDVFAHTGSFLAILIYFRKEILKMVLAFFDFFKKPKIENFSQKLLFLLLAGSLPAGILGFLLSDIIERYFRSPKFVALNLIVFGLILYWVDKKAKSQKEIKDLNFVQAFTVGLFQSLSLAPGVSRSGSTIIGGLLMGLKKDQAVEFSFLLFLPTIFGALLKEGLKFKNQMAMFGDLELFLVFFSAFLASLFAISFLLRFVKKHSFDIFVIWRIVLGILVLGILTI